MTVVVTIFSLFAKQRQNFFRYRSLMQHSPNEQLKSVVTGWMNLIQRARQEHSQGLSRMLGSEKFGCTKQVKEKKKKMAGWRSENQVLYALESIQSTQVCLTNLQNMNLRKVFQEPQLLKPQVSPKSTCTRLAENKGTTDWPD